MTQLFGIVAIVSIYEDYDLCFSGKRRNARQTSITVAPSWLPDNLSTRLTRHSSCRICAAIVNNDDAFDFLWNILEDLANRLFFVDSGDDN